MNDLNKKVALIYNPAAGELRRNPELLGRVIRALSDQGIQPLCLGTEYGGHATILAARAVAEGYQTVIVCGGDGTINEAAQSLAGTNAALAVWPGGTANILARELLLPDPPEEMAGLIAAGRTRKISLGRAVKPDGSWRRYFLLMAGIGLDASVIDGVNLSLKKRAGIGAYLASSLNYLVRMPLTPFSIDFNGKSHESTFAVIANASRYAIWFRLAPEARIDDDKLDICLFNSRSRLSYLRYVWLGLRGAHTTNPDVVYQQSGRARANSNNEALVQLDGEVVGRLPMNFEIVPGALTVVAPDARMPGFMIAGITEKDESISAFTH
ncbi:MAG: diacylglycerol kinase family lipid kinase [Acidobacteria bacterium]|nr:diacylglycerol kinase family lipid kinase [Acidobacteriota bacterium]